VKPSPEIGRRELAWLVGAAALVAVLMHGPLVLHLGRDIPKDLGDPLAQAWQVAWGGHALLHQPLSFFQSNQFWPLPDTLAFSDALVGYAPAGAIGSGPDAAVARYALLYLFAYALCAVGAALLARELGAGRGGALVAGAAFAFAPWRMEQAGHLHVISSGGIPLALFLLVRGVRRDRPGLVLAGWAVAAWQLSLGWTLGLQLAYLLAGVGALAAWHAWKAGGLASLVQRRRAIAPSMIAGIVLFAAVGGLLAGPYLRVADDHPEARRGPATVAAYSEGPHVFLAAPRDSLVWAGATKSVRDRLDAVPEQTLFPGLAILGLALAGTAGGPYGRRLRLGLALGTVAAATLALGFPSGSRWLWPYGWLYELAPGWDAVRVPERIWTLGSLGLALLAGAGAVRLRAWLRERGRLRAASVAAPALAAIVLLEGSASGVDRGGQSLAAPPHPRAPAEPAGLRGLAQPILSLPMRADDNRRYLLWSTAGFPELVNGRSSLNPRSFLELEEQVAGFPDRRSVDALRRMGVATVVVHLDRARGTPWVDAGTAPVRGLALRRDRRGELVRFLLRPR
jgi:hypothetical protein